MQISSWQNFTNKAEVFDMNGMQINRLQNFKDEGICFTSMLRI